MLFILISFLYLPLAAKNLDWEKMFSTCLERDWESVTCSLKESDDYSPSILSEYVGNNLYKLPRIINQFIEDYRKLNGP